MPRRIDYYFSMVSPWAYIGHAAFMAVARRHDVALTYKPMSLGSVFAETGGLPLAKRAPARQRYRIMELQRWREKRGLQFPIHPKFWPFNAALADQVAVAAAMEGHDLDALIHQGFKAIWEEERNLADEATIVAVADAAKLPGARLLAAAKTDAVKAVYEQNDRDAIAVDAFGSPAYVMDGEVFWGQDRIDLLADALASGRAAFRSDA